MPDQTTFSAVRLLEARSHRETNRNMEKWLSPSSIIWITANIIILLFGFIFIGNSHVSELIGASLAFAVGGSLIATGIAGEILFLHVHATDSLRSKIEIYTRAGMVDIFPFRQVRIRSEYDNRVQKATHIDIIGFGLASLREDYRGSFQEWSQRAHVRILLLDPSFPNEEFSYADQRDREEGNPIGKIRQDVEAFERDLLAIPGLRVEGFEVRLMRCLPAVNMFRVDDEMFWGPYLIGNQSRNMPTLLVQQGGFLFNALREHFDSLWDSECFTKSMRCAEQKEIS